MHLQYFFCVEIFITEIVVHLLNIINFSRREFVIWSPAHQHGSISSHQGERQALEQLPHRHMLFTALVPGQSCSNHLHLLNCCLVKASQNFNNNGEKGKALLLACLGSSLHLALKGLLSGTSGLSCCCYHICSCEGPCHCHINGGVFSIRPAPNEEIPWSCSSTW